MRAFVLLIGLGALPAFAAYDSHWHSANFWPGAFPDGFAVLKPGVSVKGRKSRDPDAPADIRCALPAGAVFHPWNAKRTATFVSENPIVPMVAKEAITIGEGADMASLLPGEKLEYLVYKSNGIFQVRYRGRTFEADQSILDKVNYDQSALDRPADEWVKVQCQNKRSAWLLLRDLHRMDANGNEQYEPGLGSPSHGVRDLPKPKHSDDHAGG